MPEQITELLQMLVEGQKRTDLKLEKIDARLNKIDARLDHIDARLDHIDSRLDKVESRLDKIDSKLVKVDSRLNKLEAQVTENTQILRTVVHSLEINKAEHDNFNHDLSNVMGSVEEIKRDMYKVEEATASNWADIARLKQIK